MISTKPSDQFRTPLDLFHHYDQRYNFTIDGAASSIDNLCNNWWGPEGKPNDFFLTSVLHWAGERVWVNPPYSMIPDFLAHASLYRDACPVSVWLLPAWPDRRWWHDFIWAGNNPRYGVDVEFLRGRPKFLNPDGSRPVDKHGRPQGGKFPSCVVTMLGI